MIIARIVILLLALLLWEWAGRTFEKVDFALSRPSEVAIQVVDLVRGGEILRHIAATGGAAALGLALGTGIGSLLGLLTWFSRTTAKLFQPFVLAFGAMPILAIAPMMIIWFGIGFQMKVALACLSTVFVAFAQSARGAAS